MPPHSSCFLQAAKAKLMATNMGLVRKLAGQYSCANAPFRDLMQEGVWGLERGLEMYDPSRQAKVSTALYWYIRDAVRKAKLLQATAIHIPLTTHEQIDKLRAVMRDWRKQHPDQQITTAELSELTRMRQPTLTRVRQASLLSERSLDLPVTTGHSTGFGSDAQANWVDKIAADELDEQVFYAQADLKSAVAQLPDPMSVIVQEKYGLLDGHAKNFKEVHCQLCLIPHNSPWHLEHSSYLAWIPST